MLRDGPWPFASKVPPMFLPKRMKVPLVFCHFIRKFPLCFCQTPVCWSFLRWGRNRPKSSAIAHLFWALSVMQARALEQSDCAKPSGWSWALRRSRASVRVPCGLRGSWLQSSLQRASLLPMPYGSSARRRPCGDRCALGARLVALIWCCGSWMRSAQGVRMRLSASPAPRQRLAGPRRGVAGRVSFWVAVEVVGKAADLRCRHGFSSRWGDSAHFSCIPEGAKRLEVGRNENFNYLSCEYSRI